MILFLYDLTCWIFGGQGLFVICMCDLLPIIAYRESPQRRCSAHCTRVVAGLTPSCCLALTQLFSDHWQNLNAATGEASE